jgi:hypothetical protein
MMKINGPRARLMGRRHHGEISVGLYDKNYVMFASTNDKKQITAFKS